MATTTQTNSIPELPVETHPTFSKKIPPLRNGDHLNSAEFLRRYEGLAHLKKAELLDGRVYIDSPESYPTVRGDLMASPDSFEQHSAPYFDLITWLGVYRAMTPGIRGGDNGTVRLDPNSMPQPDAFLLILPSHGGQTTIGNDKSVQGAPELVAEVAYSSVSSDLHEKLEIIRRHGARDYIVWRVEDGSMEWFILTEGRYVSLQPREDGIYRSDVFPGLWLDAAAFLRGEMNIVVQVVRRGIDLADHADFVTRLRGALPQ